MYGFGKSTLDSLELFILYFRNRLPNCSDDLSHWSDIFTWRQLHYKHLVKAYEGSTQVSSHSHTTFFQTHITVPRSILHFRFHIPPEQPGHGNSAPLCQCHHPVCKDSS